MLTQPTLDRLNAMKMFFMAETLQRQSASSQSTALSFEERFGMLIDAEWSGREQRKLDQRLKSARLRHPASLEDIDFKAHRGLNRELVLAIHGAFLPERRRRTPAVNRFDEIPCAALHVVEPLSHSGFECAHHAVVQLAVLLARELPGAAHRFGVVCDDRALGG